ncbi:Dynein regulatory complex subunit 2 [Gonapodya sp. JEL0774]|nr:Dynein regulatory complex subunit 2 [Gonapodya sp. JEL0774]
MPKKPKSASGAAKAEPVQDAEARRAEGRKRMAEMRAKVQMEEKMTKLNTIKVDNKWREIMKDGMSAVENGLSAATPSLGAWCLLNVERDEERTERPIHIICRDNILKHAGSGAFEIPLYLYRHSVKSTTLTTQLNHLLSSHRRTSAHLARLTSHLVTQLSEAAEQHADAARGHLEMIDNCTRIQEERMDAARLWFEGEVAKLEEEFGGERIRLLERHAISRSSFLLILRRAVHLREEAEADARHEHQSALDDVKNRDLEERHAARMQMDAVVEELQRRWQETKDTYKANTSQRSNDFNELKLRDQLHTKEIEKQVRRLLHLSESIAQLRTRMAQSSAEHEDKLRLARERREKVQGGFAELKRRMAEARKVERAKLTQATVASGGTIDGLKARVEVAERILKLAEMNGKLETEAEAVARAVGWAGVSDGDGMQGSTEKEQSAGFAQTGDSKGMDGPDAESAMISLNPDGEDGHGHQSRPHGTAPFPDVPEETTDIALHLPPLPKHSNRVSASSSPEPAKSTSITPPLLPLHNFHARLNAALLSTLHLRNRRAALASENANLRLLLQEYLDGVGVSAEVMERPNPLFVVNGRTNVEPRRLGGGGGKTVIEAAHVAGRVE